MVPYQRYRPLGTSAVKSGINTIPMVLALVISAILSGGIITATGRYVPWMFVSTILMSVGSGLTITFDKQTAAKAEENYVDFYDVHVAKFWKPRPDSGIQLIWEALQTLLSSKSREGPLTVVDMGTGTGRIIKSLFQNARAKGMKTLDAKSYGIDPGLVILQRAKETLEADQELVQIAPVEWVSTDALGLTTDSPEVKGVTDFMFFAGGGFNHLLSAGEQLGFLREVAKALRTDSPNATAMIVFLGESIPFDDGQDSEL
ncbi:hypothetical protein GJ744_002994 [Endocarpon pusillum]|uniref:Methyltransferase domain-containing protein n=1 Tax=Endocarpon pusillum TaxID=364733 RepID=A0A8H7A7D8_9EURO|nr:hypothetical protein GJ744_002994 [Endocarpon pusillum]